MYDQNFISTYNPCRFFDKHQLNSHRTSPNLWIGWCKDSKYTLYKQPHCLYEYLNGLSMRALINPEDQLILYQATLIEMGPLLSILNPPYSTLKSFDNNLSSILGTIQLLAKIRIQDENFVQTEETFYIIDSPYW